MRHFAVYLSVALVATSALGHATEAGGPSFDCAKAATPIEQAICADSTLSALDNTLAGLLKETLAREPAYREAILSDQRGWLARRDLTHSWIWSVSSSLEEIYKKRISQLQVLEDLDKTLAGILKETLARDPARREAILSEQRHWIAEREIGPVVPRQTAFPHVLRNFIRQGFSNFRYCRLPTSPASARKLKRPRSFILLGPSRRRTVTTKNVSMLQVRSTPWPELRAVA
jgi:uncharacterized protein